MQKTISEAEAIVLLTSEDVGCSPFRVLTEDGQKKVREWAQAQSLRGIVRGEDGPKGCTAANEAN